MVLVGVVSAARYLDKFGDFIGIADEYIKFLMQLVQKIPSYCPISGLIIPKHDDSGIINNCSLQILFQNHGK